MGPMWDAFDFLANAKYFAGQGFGYIDPNRPPFLSFLTSLIFRASYDSEVAIFIVDGILFFIGVLGLYLLFNLRFKPIISFIGSLFYMSFPVILLWAGAGYTDVASTSISIWAIFFTVLAVKRDNRFFYVAFPIFTLAFFTRFASALIIFPIILYLLICNNLKDFKTIIFGIIISFLFSLPFIYFYYSLFKNPLSPLLGFYGASSAAIDGPRFSFNPDNLYFLKNFLYSFINLDVLNDPNLVFKLLFILITILMGYIIILGLYLYLRRIISLSINEISLSDLKSLNILIILLATIMLIITFFIGNYLLCILSFSIICYFIYKILNNEKLRYFDLDILFVSWFFSFLIFHSIFDVKVIRYFIPMAPAITYFILVGLNEFIENFNIKIMNIKIKKAISFVLIVSLLISTFHFIYQLEHDPIANGQNFKFKKSLDENQFKLTSSNKPFTGELYYETYNTNQYFKILMNWFEKYDPNYKNKVIYSDYFWPHLRWNLKTDVGALNVNKIGKDNINDFLINSKVDYYIAVIYAAELEDYIQIAEFNTKFGKIVIYQRK
ncbi:MAG: glycosyltransferase family 39 protein [Methanomicrobiales archaeon]